VIINGPISKKYKTGTPSSQYNSASAANGYGSNKKLEKVEPRKIHR